MRQRFTLDGEGWARPVTRACSPNCDDRPSHCAVELVVIHGISLPPGQFGGPWVEQLFNNRLDHEHHPFFETLRALRVSAHFFIRRDGGVVQFVSCLRRAWHAGMSEWRGRARCNDFSIGIEIEGADDVPYEDAQYEACNALLRALARTYPLQAVAGHSDIAPGRKTDPGPCFDWTRIVALPRA